MTLCWWRLWTKFPFPAANCLLFPKFIFHIVGSYRNKIIKKRTNDPEHESELEKERCSGSYCQAVVFLVIKHDSISERPGYWQWGSRYTAHAGRNLPVKEFCYLRTNDTTAAMWFLIRFLDGYQWRLRETKRNTR